MTDERLAEIERRAQIGGPVCPGDVFAFADEVRRLRAENAALQSCIDDVDPLAYKLLKGDVPTLEATVGMLTEELRKAGAGPQWLRGHDIGKEVVLELANLRAQLNAVRKAVEQ